MSFSISEIKYLILPGYMFITDNHTSIYGVTGSGIFVGIYDKRKMYSGCCSYLYPYPPDKTTLSTKYGAVAIKHLIKKMRNKGSNVEDLKAHLIGGSDNETSAQAGVSNVSVANTILGYFMIEILSSDTGGKMGRKFIYNTEDGQSLTLKTEKVRKSDWFPYEKRENDEQE
ncbi:MAG: chemotaxis protein CheD [Candidatus Cloacimonetes bacterium]|nr:chemotaxis protein CheD [Candidatus Cloacimonadota bacterium]